MAPNRAQDCLGLSTSFIKFEVQTYRCIFCPFVSYLNTQSRILPINDQNQNV